MRKIPYPILFGCIAICGLQSLLAQPAIPNSSFEAGMEGWEEPVIVPRAGQKPGKNTISITNKDAYDGKQSLLFEVGSWSPDITVTSKLIPLPKGDRYQQVKIWLLYRGDIHREFGGRVQLYDADRKPIPNTLEERKGTFLADGDWFPIFIAFEAIPKAEYFTVQLFWSKGNGTLAFDAIELEPVAGPATTKTGYTLSELSNDNQTVWVANAQEKIYPDATKPEANGTSVQMSGARGESYSVQLVYQPKAEAQDLKVSVGELVNSGGGKLPASVVDVRYVTDVNVKSDMQQFGRGGMTPDPIETAAPAILPAGKPQSIWLTAIIPRDAGAGTYSTDLQLSTSSGTISVPLKLEVFDFEIPKVPALHTNSAASDARGARPELRKRLLANRMTSEIGYEDGILSLNVELNPDGTVRVDWAPWDKAMEQYIADGMTSFYVPRLQFGCIYEMYGQGVWLPVKRGDKGIVKYPSPEWKKAVSSYITQMYDHLQQKGWLDMAQWQIWDEPMGVERRGIVREIAALIKKSAPKAEVTVTGWPVEPNDPNIDIWVPPKKLYDSRMRKISKEEFWVYDNDLAIIDNPAGLTKMRNIGWWMWNNDITGLLWWRVTYGWANKPYENLSPYPKSNGNGLMFYPGRDGDKTKVTDSTRVAAYRAAINDYDYFTLLAQAQDAAVKKSGTSGQSGKDLVKVLISAGLDKNNPETFEQLRMLAAKMIELLKQNPAQALKLTPDFWEKKEAHYTGKPASDASQVIELILQDGVKFSIQPVQISETKK